MTLLLLKLLKMNLMQAVFIKEPQIFDGALGKELPGVVGRQASYPMYLRSGVC